MLIFNFIRILHSTGSLQCNDKNMMEPFLKKVYIRQSYDFKGGLLQGFKHLIPGINYPTLLINQESFHSPYSVEPSGLAAVFFNFGPGTVKWFFIHRSFRTTLERTEKDLLEKEFSKTIINEEYLKEKGIPFLTCNQNAGDVLVVCPGSAYFFRSERGFSTMLKWNFAPANQIQIDVLTKSVRESN